MELTIVGCSGTYPTADSACSGYLFSSADYAFQVDLGPGTFVNLQKYTAIEDLDGIFLTHWHPDHCIDIYPLFYALRFHPDRPEGLPVYGPKGAEEHLFGFLSGDSQEEFKRVFDFREVDESTRFEAGPFEVSLARTNHPVETLAVSVAEGEKRVVYSSDTGPGGGFPELADSADLAIVEATYEASGQGPPIHLSAREAGEVAALAGVGRLLITHIFPTCDRLVCLEEASSAFDGPVAAAAEGLVEVL